jgi:hypothetical protein
MDMDMDMADALACCRLKSNERAGLGCVDEPHSEARSGALDEGEVACGGLIIAGGDHL